MARQQLTIKDALDSMFESQENEREDVSSDELEVIPVRIEVPMEVEEHDNMEDNNIEEMMVDDDKPQEADKSISTISTADTTRRSESSSSSSESDNAIFQEIISDIIAQHVHHVNRANNQRVPSMLEFVQRNRRTRRVFGTPSLDVSYVEQLLIMCSDQRMIVETDGLEKRRAIVRVAFPSTNEEDWPLLDRIKWAELYQAVAEADTQEMLQRVIASILDVAIRGGGMRRKAVIRMARINSKKELQPHERM